jgi:hypothetical protein
MTNNIDAGVDLVGIEGRYGVIRVSHLEAKDEAYGSELRVVLYAVTGSHDDVLRREEAAAKRSHRLLCESFSVTRRKTILVVIENIKRKRVVAVAAHNRAVHKGAGGSRPGKALLIRFLIDIDPVIRAIDDLLRVRGRDQTNDEKQVKRG